MSTFEHSRHKIFNPAQHPLKHDISDFAYANARLPGISLLGDAMDYLVAAIYPNYVTTVANQAALPVSANPNDYYVVLDDGDGKTAGYVWSVIDNTGQWIKRYDVDWSMEAILAETVNRTLPMYPSKYGMDDQDTLGAPIAGVKAGQSIYGGASSNTHLTLHANSGDTGGAHTGFVQVDDSFRPVVDDVYSLGTVTERFKESYVSDLSQVGTLAFASGSITDSSGAIDFGNEDLSTTGDIAATNADYATSLTVDTLSLLTGSITDSTGAIDFDNENLSTTGTLAAGITTIAGDLVLGVGSITSVSGTIDFGNEDLNTLGDIAATSAAFGQTDTDNLRLDGNTLSVTNLNGNLNLQANGTGVVSVGSVLETLGQTVTGAVGITGQLNADNLRLDGNALSTTDTNGDLTLAPNGTGLIRPSSSVVPTASGIDLGAAGFIFDDLFLDGEINNGTSAILVSELLDLRSANYRDSARTLPVQAGDALFWDGSQWLASNPDTEIAHEEVSNLTTGDAGHTQFVMLAGRAGGQVVQGGTLASQSLTLESTAHATKGTIFLRDNTKPETNASYSGSWSGVDLGGSSHFFRDVFAKGEFKGFRLENFTSGTLPASSASNVGRTVYTTDDKKIYVDNGSTWTKIGAGKYSSDTSWDGNQTQQTFTVSASINDAQNAVWQLRDNTNNFEQIHATIEAISATQVRVTVGIPLPVGSYRLIGLE